MTEFQVDGLPDVAGDRRFRRLADIRAHDPEQIRRAHAARVRRPMLTDGRLLLIAADHPARGALQVAGKHDAMASRRDLLARLMIALERPGVDGVLATPDIIDDLTVLGALDGKIAAGSMNRGGLHGATFEMDDRFTAYDIPAIFRDRLDVAKILLRINLTDPATAGTLQAAARAVSDAADHRVPIMIEPFISTWQSGRIVHDLSPDAVITSIAVASGLGTSSAYTWLKIPVVDEMERVMQSTTLPALLLGGDPSGDPDRTYEKWAASLALEGVRGMVVGRALMYPSDDDVVRAVDMAAALVHGTNVTRQHTTRSTS